MSQIITIPFQEKVTVRMRSGMGEGVVSTTELRPHPFFAGPENYDACMVVSEVIRDSSAPFPIFIHAPAGYGKSHLVEGVLIAWLSRHEEKFGTLISAQEFAREWGTAQRMRTPEEFIGKYHAQDFLVLEDLQAITTHTSTQEQLARTFDALGKRDAWILVTATQPLETLALEQGLLSRLRMGVCLEITLPTVETREIILHHVISEKKIAISSGALQNFITQAESEELSTGDMLFQFQKMDMMRKVTHNEEIAETEVTQIFSENASKTVVTVKQIAQLAAKFYKIRLADLRSKSRKTTLVTVRDVVYFMARRYTDATLDEIGTYFDGRDHTTVLHGISQAERLIQNDEEVRRCVEFLVQELGLSRSLRS
ncbi:MAG: DnaA/Hda family protein [Planctomycetia bacterium]|nr:DnaA/Hda family protein [Planctomycetia bacterium]